jgi:Domain of unknown function (DUF4149)
MTTVPQPSVPPAARETLTHGEARATSSLALAPVVAAWLHIVAIGLWMGAMLGVGALVAPVAFQLAREQAGTILGESFRRLNYFGLGCAAVVGATTLVEALARRLTRASMVRLALVAGAGIIAWYLGWQVFPKMDALREAGQMAEFDLLHAHYERLGHAQFLLLLGAALATAYRSVERRSRD